VKTDKIQNYLPIRTNKLRHDMPYKREKAHIAQHFCSAQSASSCSVIQRNETEDIQNADHKKQNKKH